MTLKYNKNLNIFVFQDSQLQIEQEKTRIERVAKVVSVEASTFSKR